MDNHIGEQLLDEYISLKRKINNYLSTQIDELISNNRMNDLINLRNNFIKKMDEDGFEDNILRMNTLVNENKKIITKHDEIKESSTIVPNNKISRNNEVVPNHKLTRFKYNCAIHRNKITDEFLLTMPNLEILDLKCDSCKYYCTRFNITDLAFCGDLSKGTKGLVHLRELDCWNCVKITDFGLGRLVNLTKLRCWNCPNITDSTFYGSPELGLAGLTELT